MIAGTRKRGPELRHRPKGDAESRSRAPRGAAAGDPEIGVTARHARGAAFRTSACRRSAPVEFSGAENKQGGTRPLPSGREALAVLTIKSRLYRKASTARGSALMANDSAKERAGADACGTPRPDSRWE